MALISCPECRKEVSSLAQACPNCGVGIASAEESAAAGTRLTTVQETSKKLKMQSLLSVVLTIVGVVMMVSAEPMSSTRQFFAFLAAAGAIWYLVTKIRVWWHHG